MGRGHVVQMPFRVLNHVSADGSRPIYDLMNPVVVYQDEAKVEALESDTPKTCNAPTKKKTNQVAGTVFIIGLIRFRIWN
jgi:hypothetical protein